MFKFVLKMFLPSSETLAQYAAEGIAKTVNESGKEEVISKYSNLSGNSAQIVNWLSQILIDGKIDKNETEEISKKLIPLFEAIRKTI